jgi:ParB family chromosome partitioning protein
MADEKLNTDPAENTSPKAAEPIATPEQAAASEPR